MHTLRDPRGDGRRLRRLSRAGVLLSVRRSTRSVASSNEARQPAANSARGAGATRSVASSNEAHQPAAKAADWWASYFDAQYLLEYEPLFTLERDRREVTRLIDILGASDGAKILDVPCGQGRHAHLLAEAGFDVDGLDYSEPLLARAKARGTGKRLRYTRGDMRTLPGRWSNRFDVVVNLFTSFGFFTDPADDARVIHEFARVLQPGGVLVWHGGNRDGVMAHFLARDWWETQDGTLIAHERSFDGLSGVLTIRSTWRGRKTSGEREHRIRLYTPTRLAELCADAGLVVEQAFDGFNDRELRRRSSEMLLVARKEPLPRRKAKR